MTSYIRRFGKVMKWILAALGSGSLAQACFLGLSSASTVGAAGGFLGLLVLVTAWGVWGYEHWQHRRLVLVGLIFPFALLMTGCGTRVNPGHVGIKVNYYGSQRGVEDYPLVTGYVWYNPFTTTVFEYPTFVQTAVWTRSKDEGTPLNEEITFNSSEGLVFTADMSLSYSLEPSRVPHFYVKFRNDDLKLFTHGFLRNIARDAFNDVAARYTAQEIYADKKELMIRQVRDRINEQTTQYGVRLDQFGFIGAPRPPENVVTAINGKIKATQDAIRVENEVRQAKAEAAKTVATAQGAAQAAIAKAEGDARANQILTASLTAPLLEWRRLELQQQAIARWNGQQPSVLTSGGGLLFNIPTK